MLDNRQHRNRRKITGQSISEKAMRDFEPIMTEQIEVFIQQLAASARASSPVNMTERCKRLGMDIVALLAFGYDLKLQTEATNRHILAGLSVGTYQFNCFMQFPFLKTLRVDRLLEVLAYRQKQKYTANLRQMIGARLSESPQAKRDLYSFFAKHIEDTADAIETSEIFSEAFLFFPAGRFFFSFFSCPIDT
ncbi:putative benzoate 4-monooxygenase cytochrome P450 protein [Rosellinia necatrix]|uniref:Putative benzoate 4-monooxygenase cytochrome P450 protein n=1 Tax=Rosellinia necatrix TaxID=77044 RepID=A0A1S8AA59_ROSNE|nr:putative benzoate 4-monooxygenase cytochrome P450 protein [Rosellinia necatrix]